MSCFCFCIKQMLREGRSHGVVCLAGHVGGGRGVKVTSPFKTHFGSAAALPSPIPFSHYTLPYTNPYGYSTFNLLPHLSKQTYNPLFKLHRFSLYSMDYNYPTVCIFCFSPSNSIISIEYFLYSPSYLIKLIGFLFITELLQCLWRGNCSASDV